MLHFIFILILLVPLNIKAQPRVNHSCPKINEPEFSNGYFFDQYCSTVFILPSVKLNGSIKYDKESIVNACKAYEINKENPLLNKNITIHTVYSYDFSKNLEGFRELNTQLPFYFLNLPHSYSVAAVPNFKTAMDLDLFPINGAALNGTEAFIRAFFEENNNLEEISYESDRYNLFPFNNILQNKWILNVQAVCPLYFDIDNNSFNWIRFENDRLVQLTPTVVSEFSYLEEDNAGRLQAKSIRVSSYYSLDRGGSNDNSL